MVVMHALYELYKKSLYRQEHVVIDKEGEMAFQGISRKEETTSIEPSPMYLCEDISNMEPIAETLVHGLIHSQLIYDLEDKLLKLHLQRDLGH